MSARWLGMALPIVCGLLGAGCASGNQALYEPAYGSSGPPQCGISDARPPPSPPTPWNPPTATKPRAIALQPWQQHAQVSQMIAGIAQQGAYIGRMLEQARAQRDVVKTTCMNDKLTQLDVALRSAVDHKVGLTEAANRGDVEQSTHEFAVITALNDRASQISAEASQCVGEEMAFAGDNVASAQMETVVVSGRSRTTSDVARRAPGVARDESQVQKRVAQAPPPAPPPASNGSTGGMRGPTTPAPAPPPRPPPVASPPPRTPPPAAPASVLTIDAPHDASLMVYSADVGLAVPHIGKGLDAVEAIARDIGGYLSQRADREITIFVPRAKFTDAIARIERLGDVRHHSISALDVTDEFVDLEVRITNARAVRERLIALRAQAKTVSAQLEAEVEIGRLTGEIDRMEGKLKLLSEKIAYSTITVAFEPVAEAMVCATTVLPFPWLQDVGLAPLLNVHE